jgi:hypothetical protein
MQRGRNLIPQDPNLGVLFGLEGNEVPCLHHSERITVVDRKDETHEVGVHGLVAVLGPQVHMATQGRHVTEKVVNLGDFQLLMYGYLS